ncbi:hypothetical protein ACTQ34_10695 [Agathobaculum sp. LCP25S3_E8]|uniref:hypothetical protein n=1 Tax=Agathobaculum sp. LCP25S3_E8 TaxID=3438735 RepID=UPI003F913BB7
MAKVFRLGTAQLSGYECGRAEPPEDVKEALVFLILGDQKEKRDDRELQEIEKTLMVQLSKPNIPLETGCLLNPAGQYAVKFAENHSMSINEAMEQPMVKARFEFFNQTGR